MQDCSSLLPKTSQSSNEDTDPGTRQFKHTHTHTHTCTNTRTHSCPSHYEPEGVTGRHARRGFVVKSFGEEGEREREIGGVEKRRLHGEYFNTKTHQLAWAPFAWTDKHTHTHTHAHTRTRTHAHTHTHTHTHIKALAGPYLLQLA